MNTITECKGCEQGKHIFRSDEERHPKARIYCQQCALESSKLVRTTEQTFHEDVLGGINVRFFLCVECAKFLADEINDNENKADGDKVGGRIVIDGKDIADAAI